VGFFWRAVLIVANKKLRRAGAFERNRPCVLTNIFEEATHWRPSRRHDCLVAFGGTHKKNDL
jgi:hypothetical protein